MSGYSRTVIRAIVLGLFGGGFGLLYLWLVHLGTDALWGDWETMGWFSGSVRSVMIPLVAGLLVGIVYKFFDLPTRFHGFIQELEQGHVDPKSAPGAIVIALFSLVGGASVGPEAPLGTAGGAAGTWLARRSGEDEQGVRQSSFIGISGVFGGLLSTPIGGPLLAFELEHDQTSSYYLRHLVPGVISGAVAFGVMWPVIGAPFSGLLEIQHGDFESWMLLAAAGLGVFSALAALVVGKVMLSITNAMRTLDSSPVVRGLVGGAVVALGAFVLPLTLFSGQEAAPFILDRVDEIGLAMLLGLAVVKTITLGASFGGGFYGGPIFPMFFIATALGLAVHLVFPALPLGIAVGATMAGLGAAVALVPISMAVLATILTQSGLVASAAIVVSAAVAFAIRHALMPPGGASDAAQTAAPTHPV